MIIRMNPLPKFCTLDGRVRFNPDLGVVEKYVYQL